MSVDQTIQVQVGLPSGGDGGQTLNLTQILILATILGGILLITGALT